MLRPAAPLLVTCLVAIGCGGEDEPAQVREVVTAFGEATAKKDYQRICDDLLAPALVTNLQEVGLPCEVALKQGLDPVQRPKLTLGEVRVDGDRATAAITTTAANQDASRDTLQLAREDGTWRITALRGPAAPAKR